MGNVSGSVVYQKWLMSVLALDSDSGLDQLQLEGLAGREGLIKTYYEVALWRNVRTRVLKLKRILKSGFLDIRSVNFLFTPTL